MYRVLKPLHDKDKKQNMIKKQAFNKMYFFTIQRIVYDTDKFLQKAGRILCAQKADYFHNLIRKLDSHKTDYEGFYINRILIG
jgi:hypothetical protein